MNLVRISSCLRCCVFLHLFTASTASFSDAFTKAEDTELGDFSGLKFANFADAEFDSISGDELKENVDSDIRSRDRTVHYFDLHEASSSSNGNLFASFDLKETSSTDVDQSEAASKSRTVTSLDHSGTDMTYLVAAENVRSHDQVIRQPSASGFQPEWFDYSGDGSAAMNQQDNDYKTNQMVINHTIETTGSHKFFDEVEGSNIFDQTSNDTFSHKTNLTTSLCSKCRHNATCQVVSNITRCICPIGFTGSDCYYVIDEEPCKNGNCSLLQHLQQGKHSMQKSVRSVQLNEVSESQPTIENSFAPLSINPSASVHFIHAPSKSHDIVLGFGIFALLLVLSILAGIALVKTKTCLAVESA